MTDAHKHEYRTTRLLRLVKIDNPGYNGTSGDKAFLARWCACGDFKVFEYGSYPAMRALLASLTKEGADDEGLVREAGREGNTAGRN